MGFDGTRKQESFGNPTRWNAEGLNVFQNVKRMTIACLLIHENITREFNEVLGVSTTCGQRKEKILLTLRTNRVANLVTMSS